MVPRMLSRLLIGKYRAQDSKPHYCELPGRLGVHKCHQRLFRAALGPILRRGSKVPLVTLMNYPELVSNRPYGPEFGGFGQVVRNVEIKNATAWVPC